MSTTKYEVFLKSAQLGNFTRAAEVCVNNNYGADG